MSAPPSPSGDARGATDRRALAALIALAGALLVVRLVLASLVHLTEDEAYYRLWAQAPALGYFDHPPMIAWWIWVGVHLAGDTPLGVRLLPAVACAATTLLVFDSARLAGAGVADARRAGVWYNATLLVAAGGFLAVPDAPAAFFWALCLWAALRALRAEDLGWWLAAGASAGLASLSKYSALFLGPGVLIWLLWTPSGRRSLRSPGPWLALVVAAGLFSLNVAWNGTHHWLTFAKQFGRITAHRWAPRYLIEFLATECLLLNPLLAAWLARMAARGGIRDRAALTPFVATSLPFVGYLLLHSLHDRIQAHWPAPVYPALAACAAIGAGSAAGGWARLRAAVPGVAVAVCALAVAGFAAPSAGLPLRFDPGLPVRGWPAFSRRIEALRRQVGAGWVGVPSYGLAAQLLDEPAITAPVLQIRERDRWRGLVSGGDADPGQPGLLVDLPRRMDPRRLRDCFAVVQPLGAIVRGLPGEPGKRYVAFLVEGPRRGLVTMGCGAGEEGAAETGSAGRAP